MPFLILTGVVSDPGLDFWGSAVPFPRLSSIAFESELVVLGLRLALDERTSSVHALDAGEREDAIDLGLAWRWAASSDEGTE